MLLGSQYIARAGFGPLKKDTRYHFMCRDEHHGRVVLAHFDQLRPKAYLAFVELQAFDRGLGKQIESVEPDRLPPCLSNLADVAFVDDYEPPAASDGEDGRNEGHDCSRAAVVEGRMQVIRPLLDDWQQIFLERDPIRALNHIARRCGQNEGRMRFWFIAYLAFGMNKWVLSPKTTGRGTYVRDDATIPRARQGRPHHEGREFGHNVTTAVKALIEEGFELHARKGKTLLWVYEKSMLKPFGCTTQDYARKGGRHKDRTRLIHPTGEPFPTYGQFRYWAVKLLTHKAVWTALLGDQEYRNRYEAPRGSYSEGQQDLLEHVYTDAAYSKSHPRSLLHNFVLPKLCMVHIRDGTSGMIVGAGYGFGEREVVYKQALACAAMPKSLWAEVLGIELEDEAWPVQHVPLYMQSDQGAGAAKGMRTAAHALDMSDGITPAYTPQSNSPIESIHERRPRTAGAPSYEVSRDSALHMARQNVNWVLAKNRSTDVTDRLNPGPLSLNLRSPIEIWRDYLERGRISGRQKNLIDVITELVPRVTFVVRQGKLTRDGVVFRSNEFSATEFGRSIVRREGQELQGHAFEISNRLGWVVVDRQLIKVKAVGNARAQNDELAMNTLESQRYAQLQRDNRSGTRYQRHAESIRMREKTLEQTGRTHGATEQRTGRAKTGTVSARREVAAHRS